MHFYICPATSAGTRSRSRPNSSSASDGTPRIDSFYKNVYPKKKAESRAQTKEETDLSEGQVVVNLEKPCGKKIKLTVDETKTVKSILPPTEEGFIVRMITDGQVAKTVEPQDTFKDLLGGSTKCINMVLENI